MISTFDHPVLGEVTFAQSPRARRVTLTVRPSGCVRISYPRGVSQERTLAFLEAKVEWVVSARLRMAQRLKAMPPALPAAEERLRIEELRRAAKIDLPQRVEHLSHMLGLHYGRLTIRASRTKWGSCTSQNNLSLSLFLMTLPEHLRDYVIVHELCHTVHHNHSPRFHALVDHCLGGNEKALNGELKAYTIRR